MRKMKYVAFWLLVALPVLAQDIPLFDDELPNLGRQAQPLSELRITPSELPDVSVSLKENPNKKITKVTPSSERPVTPAARKIQLRDEQVKLSSEQSQALNKQLQAEMQQFQDQKAKEEQEKKDVKVEINKDITPVKEYTEIVDEETGETMFRYIAPSYHVDIPVKDI